VVAAAAGNLGDKEALVKGDVGDPASKVSPGSAVKVGSNANVSQLSSDLQSSALR